MQINPETFDHNALRCSVVKLWRHRKAFSHSNEGKKNRCLASQCQEDVAKMLGLGSWSKIKNAIKISRHIQREREEKDRYPSHNEVITPETAVHFLDWAQNHGVDYLFMSGKRIITYYFPGESGSSHKATSRNIERHEIHAIMQALSFQEDFLEKFHGALHFSRMMSVNQQEPVLWRGEFFQREDHCSLQFKRRIETNPSVWGCGVRLPKEKEVLLLDKGLVIFIDTNIHGSRSTIKAAVDERLSSKGDSPESLVYHAMSDISYGPSERESGRFRPSFSETSHCKPHMLDLMKGRDFLFVAQRCVESQMLDTAMKVAQYAPVYLGICGSYSDDDLYLQRASNGLVRAIQMFKGNDWKVRAMELFSVLNAVVCFVSIGQTRVKEYLILDDELRKKCQEELDKSSTPMDLHFFLAAKILEQKHGIIDDLIDLGGNISDEGANFALSAERAWKSNIEKMCLDAGTPDSSVGHPKVFRI